MTKWSRATLFMVIALSLTFTLVFASIAFGGTGASPQTDEINVTLTNDAWISIDSPADVGLGNITAKGVNVTGNATWTVETNNYTGYTLSVSASQTNAMKRNGTSETFADYTNGTAGTPTIWSIGANEALFGFSANGSHVDAKWSNGTKFAPFNSTTGITVASNGSYVDTGTTTGVYFEAGVGSSKNQPSGGYTAVITATAATQ